MLDAIWSRRRDILELACALFFAWWLLYAANNAGNQYQASHHDPNEYSAIFLIAFALSPFRAIGFFISENEAGIVAGITTAATVAIAWFTATIWSVNRSQLDRSEEIERAYIFATVVINDVTYPLTISGVRRDSIPVKYVEVVFENHGKTPGYISKVALAICLPQNLPRVAELPADYTRSTMPADLSVGPGQRVTFYKRFEHKTAQGNAIYGRVYFNDIFGKPHSSGFINYVQTQIIGPLIALPEYTAWE